MYICIYKENSLCEVFIYTNICMYIGLSITKKKCSMGENTYIHIEYTSGSVVCENSSLNSSVGVYIHIYKYIVYIIYKYTLYTYIYHTCYFIPLVSKYIWIYVYAYMECMHMYVARKSCVIV